MPIILLGLVATNLAIGFALGRFVHPMLFEPSEAVYIPHGPFPTIQTEAPQPEAVVTPEEPSKPAHDHAGFMTF